MTNDFLFNGSKFLVYLKAFFLKNSAILLWQDMFSLSKFKIEWTIQMFINGA